MDWDSDVGRNHARTCHTEVIEIGNECESYGRTGRCGDDRVRRVHIHRHDVVTGNGQDDSRLFCARGPYPGHRTYPIRRGQVQQHCADRVDLVTALADRGLAGPSFSAFC